MLNTLFLAQATDSEYGFIWLIVGVLLIICLIVWLLSRFR